ncbi:hypothetical protein C8A00DRAFT_34915 [Chaetomidium leptoderma]|uniref:Uncharacterized protein n=1 Tax=Chaetomidium leptoderma TaxID=669021 RepID=A0AAN6VIW4_9PEZI|nr:hypothetical protein C8A00DRAFT_34915 [Chaetomidium leptoderma]
MAEVSSRLWISQTPNLVVGYHQNGVFDNVQLRDMTEDLRQWEITNQGDLCKLAGLLTKIIGVVKLSGDRRALVQYDGLSSRLKISATSKGKRALPEDLYAKWELKGEGDDEHSAQAGLGDITKLKIKDNESQTTPLPLIPDGTPQTLLNMLTLQSLPIDVLAGRGVRDVMGDMRQGKSDWDPEERTEIRGSKDLARDSAFRLLYLILVDESAMEARNRNSVYNATDFVVSHGGIFKCRTRKMVCAAFEGRFHVSDKQRKNLDKWPIGSEVEEREDVTTEEDLDCYHYFDSDSSDYYF